jgi:hypothetical protein
MACLVLGLACAHLARGAGRAPARIPKRGIVLSLAAPPGADTKIDMPTRVHLAERDAQGGLCRRSAVVLERLPTPGWTIVLPLAAAGDVAMLVKAAKVSGTELVEEGRGNQLPACSLGPKVIYGSP